MGARGFNHFPDSSSPNRTAMTEATPHNPESPPLQKSPENEDQMSFRTRSDPSNKSPQNIPRPKGLMWVGVHTTS